MFYQAIQSHLNFNNLAFVSVCPTEDMKMWSSMLRVNCRQNL